MPFTGTVRIRGRVYAARTVTGIAEWVAVPHGYSDGTHIDYRPKLMVEVEILKNFNTPPAKLRVGGKIPARTWIKLDWVSPYATISGLEIDIVPAGPRPSGKAWKKMLKGVY